MSEGSGADQLAGLTRRDVAADIASQMAEFANRIYFGESGGLEYDTLGPIGEDDAVTLIAFADDQSQRQFRVTVRALS